MNNDFGIKGYTAAFTRPVREEAVSSISSPHTLSIAGQSAETEPASGVASAGTSVDKRGAIEETVQELNSLAQDLHRELRFSVDEETGDTVIKIVDQKTDEVIRQIPSEELIELRQRLAAATGAIFSDSA